MSIRIYFHSDRLIAAGGVLGKSPNGLFSRILIGDFVIDVPDQEDPYIYSAINPILYVLPDSVDSAWIKNVTAYHDIPDLVSRRTGEYQYRTARAVLVKVVGKKYYHMEISGKILWDVQELYRLLLEGKIWPMGDHEAEMVPPPCRHIRQLLRELWELILRDLSQKLRELRSRTSRT